MFIGTHKTGMPATVVATLSCVLFLLWSGSVKELVIVPLVLTLGCCWKATKLQLRFLTSGWILLPLAYCACMFILYEAGAIKNQEFANLFSGFLLRIRD